MVISIAVDSDRGHCYEHFKKNIKFFENIKNINVFEVCVCDKFWAARNAKKVKFWTFQAQPASGLFLPYFVCKSSFRVILMIKMVILDQCKPISLILKIK